MQPPERWEVKASRWLLELPATLRESRLGYVTIEAWDLAAGMVSQWRHEIYAARGRLAWFVFSGLVILFLITGWSPPGWTFLVNYVALAAACSIVAMKLANATRIQAGPRRRLLIAAFVIGGAVIWGRHDSYVYKWISDDGSEHFNSTYRWGGIFHKRIVERGPDGDLRFSLEGPVSESGKWHGKWSFVDFKTFGGDDKYYWYGDEISEGQWHLRNR